MIDPLPLSEFRALAELRHQIRAFLAFSESQARDAGVEPQQHQVLLAVKGLPEGARATVGTVAARMLLKHHSVVELADWLERAGLLERKASPVDGREMLLTITPKGERVLKKLTLAHQEELRMRGPALVNALETIARPRRHRAPSKKRRAA